MLRFYLFGNVLAKGSMITWAETGYLRSVIALGFALGVDTVLVCFLEPPAGDMPLFEAALAILAVGIYVLHVL